MVEQDRMQFAKVLAASLDAYGRRPPMAETVEFWFQIMRPFSMEQFRLACQQAVIQNPNNPPTPGSVLQILQKDDRPGVEEAWSLAVKASDEAETVIVTDEIMQAWSAAQPIFNLGDEVGARMAFKEVYARLIASPAPAKWWPSVGTDPHKRDTAIAEAKRQGLLPAPQAAAVLPAPIVDDGDMPPWERVDPKEQIQRIKDELKGLQLVKLKAQEEFFEALQAENRAQKQAMADAVAKYKGEGK
jgi:hypothetical protein